VDVLSIVHGEDAGTELFAPLVAEAGHRLEEWSFHRGTVLPRPLDDYGAVFIFGGGMHIDQEDRHPWLRDEARWLSELLESRVPTLGVCLGSQLLARAAGAQVGRLVEPEIGWSEVELTEAGTTDPVLSALPARFEAFQWHYYGHELPEGAVELARNAASLQGFRLRETLWGVQFHPEVTEPQVERWIGDESDPAPDPEGLRAETRRRIGGWNELGRRLCRSFLTAAERLAGDD
jgi:GMP synthase-like glutamine amidotransferase